jgi:hypothetical protein
MFIGQIRGEEIIVALKDQPIGNQNEGRMGWTPGAARDANLYAEHGAPPTSFQYSFGIISSDFPALIISSAEETYCCHFASPS